MSYALKRREELDNLRFQILLQGDGESSRNRKAELLTEYNNWMYPDRIKENADFAIDAKKKFDKFKKAFYKKAMSSKEVDPDKKVLINVGKK